MIDFNQSATDFESTAQLTSTDFRPIPNDFNRLPSNCSDAEAEVNDAFQSMPIPFVKRSTRSQINGFESVENVRISVTDMNRTIRIPIPYSSRLSEGNRLRTSNNIEANENG